jgi:hypothetical protein
MNMKSFIALITMVLSFALLFNVGSALANDPIAPPSATWAGTTDISWTAAAFPKRVGILAYCADMYHNAGDTGLQSNKVDVRRSREKHNLAALAVGDPIDSGLGSLGYWFLDGPFDNLGNYGAQNLADYFSYDDSIDRERDIQIIDGDLLQPTATQLIHNFDIVIAYTDNKCGQPIPPGIAFQAANALAGFISSPGKKLILTGFAFSSSIGFGNAIFANGLSPLTKGGPGLAACTRGTPCQIGSCPSGCTPQGAPAECKDPYGNVCGFPTYQPLPAVADLACSEMLKNVNGPTSSSWATALTSANVASGATLCFNYDTPNNRVPFIAMNAARNIIAVNAFPPDAIDIQKFWFGCMFGNMIQFLSGDTNRCNGVITCH